MFGFIKKLLVVAMTFSCNALKCVSMNNQESIVRLQVVNINNDNPLFYTYSTEINKFSGSCNNINDPYEKIWVSNVVKTIHIKVFNLAARTNETRHREWLKTCKCKCR